jgi:hypothetical protein
MKVVHGSKVKGIEALAAKLMAGNNGSQDGIGVNLTDNVQLALNYATEEGSLYIVDLDTEGFLEVSDSARLNSKQIDSLMEILSEVDDKLKYRLASDMCGKNEKSFPDDKEAEKYYKEEIEKFKSLDLGLDRLKPKIDYHDLSDDMVIITANKEFNFVDVSTKQIHYCLNLYDNLFATNVLKKLSTGLIIERDGGGNNYLSFRYEEPVMKELTGPVMAKENLRELVENICNKKDIKFENNGLEM